tara:strand:- start:2241 stop:3128 length:888 start_codon:yes stop_codon:yes gene_type:complete
MLGLGSSLATGGALAPERVLIASYSFNDDTGTGSASTTLPSGWQNGGGGAHTLYSSVTSNASSFWRTTYYRTGSNYTGPGGAHVGGPDTLNNVVTDGTWDSTSNATTSRYWHYEATGSGNDNDATSQVSSLRTNELDFSDYASVEMTFWFHAYSDVPTTGDHFTSNVLDGNAFPGGFAVACTTSSSSASSASQSGTGLGLTSQIGGGATAVYTNQAGSVVSTQRLANNGATQASGHSASLADNNKWIKATVDLSAAAGQSSNYIYFIYFTHHNGTQNFYGQDFSFDSVSIIGTKP